MCLKEAKKQNKKIPDESRSRVPLAQYLKVTLPASKSTYHSPRFSRSILCHEQRGNDVAHTVATIFILVAHLKFHLKGVIS